MLKLVEKLQSIKNYILQVSCFEKSFLGLEGKSGLTTLRTKFSHTSKLKNNIKSFACMRNLLESKVHLPAHQSRYLKYCLCVNMAGGLHKTRRY